MSDGNVRLRRTGPDADPSVLVVVRCLGLLSDGDQVAVVHVNDDLVVLSTRQPSPGSAAGLADDLQRLLAAGSVRGWQIDER